MTKHILDGEGKNRTNVSLQPAKNRSNGDGAWSILATSPNNIIFINMEIAEELKDFNSAVMIDHLVNLSLPLPEKTIFTKEKVGKILIWASPREINKVIRNLEKREILDKSVKPKGWIVNIGNLEKFVGEIVGGVA